MMFNVSQDKKTLIDLPIISSNYTVLHYDEFPMLFYGSNQYGNNIIGSLMCEEEESDIFRYLYILATPYDFASFLKGKISYRELIAKQRNVFLIDKNFEEDILSTYFVSIADIPEDFLPHPKLFSPASELIVGSDFSVSLKGKLADIHEAIADRLQIISKGINQFFATITDIISTDGVESEIHQLAYSPTSFGLNYRIVFRSQNLFFNEKSEHALSTFVAKTIDYSLNHLPSEAKNLLENNIENTQFQKLVEKPLRAALETYGRGFDDKIKQRVLNSIKKVPSELEKITEQLGMGFDYLEINSLGAHDEKSQIGIVDRAFSNDLFVAKEIIEAGSENVEKDEVYKNYDIHVYHLNKLTKKGNAHIKNTTPEGKELLDSPKIDIKGEKQLDGSEFIDSMDTGGYITVRAKAKKVNGRFKHLEIEF